MVSVSIHERVMARIILEKQSTMKNRYSFSAAGWGREKSRSRHTFVSSSVGGNVLRYFVLRRLPTRYRAHCMQLATTV